MVNAKQAANVEEGQKRIANSLENGEAMKKFAAMMKAQGVSPDTVAKLTKSHADTIAALPRAKFTRHLECMKPGTHSSSRAQIHICCMLFNWCSMTHVTFLIA